MKYKKFVLFFLTVMVTVSMLCLQVFAANERYDCSSWAEDGIAMAYAIGLVDPDKTYLYRDSVTREDFCELIYDLIVQTDYFERWGNEQTKGGTEPLPPFAKRPFDDTKNEAVYILYNHDFVYGKTVTEFAPKDKLTREEAATIIMRTVYIVRQMTSTEGYYAYVDADEISEWSQKAVQTVSNLGLMKGVGDGRFAPKDTYTVEQAIVTVLRIHNAFKDSCVLKFEDSNGNIFLTEDDLVSCNAVCGDINEYGGKDWYLSMDLTGEAQIKFKNVTKMISESSERYISISFENSVISKPLVYSEMDSESVFITGAFTEERVKALESVINAARK